MSAPHTALTAAEHAAEAERLAHITYGRKMPNEAERTEANVQLGILHALLAIYRQLETKP